LNQLELPNQYLSRIVYPPAFLFLTRRKWSLHSPFRPSHVSSKETPLAFCNRRATTSLRYMHSHRVTCSEKQFSRVPPRVDRFSLLAFWPSYTSTMYIPTQSFLRETYSSSEPFRLRATNSALKGYDLESWAGANITDDREIKGWSTFVAIAAAFFILLAVILR
jgi:hypothetical protein